MRRKKNEMGELETYGEVEEEDKPKEGLLKKIWNKTVFPDKIKEKKEKARFEEELRAQAKEEAQEEIRKQLIEKYKKEEIDKATGKKKPNNWGQKLADGFSMGGTGTGTNKFADALGASGQGIVNEDKISGMISSGKTITHEEQHKPQHKKLKKKSTKKKQPQEEQKVDDFEDRIKRMLG